MVLCWVLLGLFVEAAYQWTRCRCHKRTAPAQAPRTRTAAIARFRQRLIIMTIVAGAVLAVDLTGAPAVVKVTRGTESLAFLSWTLLPFLFLAGVWTRSGWFPFSPSLKQFPALRAHIKRMVEVRREQESGAAAAAAAPTVAKELVRAACVGKSPAAQQEQEEAPAATATATVETTPTGTGVDASSQLRQRRGNRVLPADSPSGEGGVVASSTATTGKIAEEQMSEDKEMKLRTTVEAREWCFDWIWGWQQGLRVFGLLLLLLQVFAVADDLIHTVNLQVQQHWLAARDTVYPLTARLVHTTLQAQLVPELVAKSLNQVGNTTEAHLHLANTTRQRMKVLLIVTDGMRYDR